jgi:hypothetical protein
MSEYGQKQRAADNELVPPKMFQTQNPCSMHTPPTDSFALAVCRIRYGKPVRLVDDIMTATGILFSKEV